jgi:hypothetical protein
VRPNGGGEKAEWATVSSVTSRAVVRRDNPRGRRQPVATGAERSLRDEHGHREQGWHVGLGDRPGQSNENGPLTCGPDPLNNFSNFHTPLKIVNSKRLLSHAPKIFELCMPLDLNILNDFLHWVDF